MKKCVKCDRKYNDSVLICDDCGLYLIADVVSDLGESPPHHDVQRNTGVRRRRVVPVEDPTTEQRTSTRSNNTKPFSSGFEPSSETADPTNHSSNSGNAPSTYRSGAGFRRAIRNFIRRYYPIIRIVIPIILLIIAVVWIAANQAIVSDFLHCCIISGIVGGALLTFLSVRFGHHFNIDVVTVGVIGGMIIGCLLKYNVFGTATDLLSLINGVGPCIIVIIGIYIAIRGMFR